MDEYQGILLPANECDTLHELECQIGVPIPRAPNSWANVLGFRVRHGHVIALNVSYHSNTKKSPKPISQLPRGLWSFERLERLNLEFNPLGTIPEEIGRLTTLKQLDLASIDLKRVPDVIGMLENLQVLNVSLNTPDEHTFSSGKKGSPLELPDTLGNLKALKELSIHSNLLTTLPSWISQLSALESLHASDNLLSTFPEEVCRLPALKELVLDNNRLTALPGEIGDLKSLEELVLWNNQLSSLPKGVWNLPALERLSIEMNRFVSLPDDIKNLTSLTELEVSGNILGTLPDALLLLPSLKRLRIEPRLKSDAVAQALKARKVRVDLVANRVVLTDEITGDAILAHFPSEPVTFITLAANHGVRDCEKELLLEQELEKLVTLGKIVVETQDKWKYYRLAGNPSVMVAYENILKHIPKGKYIKLSTILKALDVPNSTEAPFLELRIKLKSLLDQGKVEEEIRNRMPYYRRV